MPSVCLYAAIAIAADPTPTVAVVPAAPGYESWEDMLAQARSTTVNRYLWGGSAATKEFVVTHCRDVPEAEFGITLNRVPVDDSVDAANFAQRGGSGRD